MVNTIGSTTTWIGHIYTQSRNAATDSQIKLAAGKKYLQPKDGVGEYFTIDRLNRDRRGYESIQRDLQSGISMVTTAESVGMQLVDHFRELKRLTSDYWEAPAGSDERDLIKSEFNGVVAGMQSVIDGAVFNGKDLFQAGDLLTMMLNPNDISQTYTVSYAAGDIADVSGLTVDGGADYQATIDLIDAENDKTLSYLSKTSGYINGLNAQIGVTDAMISNNSSIVSTLGDVDDAAELKKMISEQIRQQASISMMSQANMMQFALLKLFD